MIYAHVPYCLSFCRYCDFYSEITCKKDFDGYIDEICAEARRRSAEIIKSQGVNTLYIGGGTPSVMPLRFFNELVKAVGGGPFEEFTVEVNPEDIVTRGEDFLRSLRGLGVNRISMGVQSLDDEVLRWMGRRHDAATAVRAFHMLREAGFGIISVDIIFGIGSWEGGAFSSEILDATLDGILALGPDHISAYQLSIEDGARLARDLASGKYAEASDEECAMQYQLICSRLREAGFVHYEISNWARAGMEAVHNSAYWTRQPYVGLGPGAHSLTVEDRGPGLPREIRSWNSQVLTGWTSSHEILTPEEIREEQIMLGLRTAKGIDLDGKHIVIPEDRWFVADSIIAGLI